MWARDAEVALAAWLALGPFVLAPAGRAHGPLALDLACGALIALLALASYARPLRRAHLGELPVAMWLVAQGWSEGATPAAQSRVIVGLLVATLAIVPSRANEPPDGWRSR